MSVLVASPKLSHPALFTCYPTPPATPTSPVAPKTQRRPASKATSSRGIPKANAPYALLRAHHIFALETAIARLRWEQTNNNYIRGEDAWLYHDRLIGDLELEIRDVKEAQKTLDRFPNCYAPTSHPEPHGPLSKEAFAEKERKAREEERKINEKLEAEYPFIKQMFIGPMTRQQARNDKRVRDMILVGDHFELSYFLPTENKKAMSEYGREMRKKALAAKGPPAKTKKAYEDERMEREKAKIQAYLSAHPPPPRKVVTRPKIGPLTKSEYLSSLPVYGPKTKGEAMLPHQRDQRQLVLHFLRRPWGVWDEKAAHAIDELFEVAKIRLEEDARAHRIGPKTREEAKADGEV